MNAPVMHFRGNPNAKHGQHGSPTLRRYVLGAGADPESAIDPDDREIEVDIIQGPVESGKSAGSFGKVYKTMCTVPRDRNGKRRSRILIHRQTYPEIHDTVLPDFLEWFPEKEYGKLTGSEPIIYKMRFLDVECDVVFMALPDASEKTIKKLKSGFYTAAYGNEGQFNELALVVNVIDRTGRFPHKKDNPEYDRKRRYFTDMNAPPWHDHWVLYMRGDTPLPADMPRDQAMAYQKPPGWEFYVQPPAVFERIDEGGNLVGYELNPHAENLQNMGENPYLPACGGKTRDQIDRDFRNITRPQRAGAARYPMFTRDKHVARSQLQPRTDKPIILGLDGGLTPACTFWQHIEGRWYGLYSLTATNKTADEFAPMVKSVLTTHFPFASETGVAAYGDPSMDWSAEQGRRTSMMIFASHGIEVTAPAKKDQPQTRMEMGRRLLKEFPDGNPRILLCPIHCTTLIASLENMQMAQVKTAFGLKVQEKLVKDKWSHTGEAAEYAWWGGGEAKQMFGRPKGERSRSFNMTGKAKIGQARDSWTSIRRAG